MGQGVNSKPERRRAAKKAFLESLRKGATMTAAAKAAGVSFFSIWKWRKDSPQFNAQVNEILDSRAQVVEDALYKAAVEKGNVQAQMFFLKNRARDRWRDQFDVGLEDNVKIRVEIEGDKG